PSPKFSSTAAGRSPGVDRPRRHGADNARPEATRRHRMQVAPVSLGPKGRPLPGAVVRREPTLPCTPPKAVPGTAPQPAPGRGGLRSGSLFLMFRCRFWDDRIPRMQLTPAVMRPIEKGTPNEDHTWDATRCVLGSHGTGSRPRWLGRRPGGFAGLVSACQWNE